MSQLLVKILGLGADAAISDPPYTAPVSEEWVGELYPISWSIKREQDSTGSWSFTVPFTAKFRNQLKRYAKVYFYLDGEEIMFGLIDDLQIDVSGDKVVYSVSGLGEVALLDRTLSVNLSHYDAVEVIVILQEALRWAGWRLGDFMTMQNITAATTIDLRDCETVLQQVQRICESVPGVHYRWGGYDCNGRPTLDVGFFDQVQNVTLTQGREEEPQPHIGYVQTASISSSYINLISEVHGNGGVYNLSTDPDKQRTMAIWHVNELLTAFPALVNPDFPVVQDGNGFYRVRNINLYPEGSNIRKSWDFMVTRNEDPPTLAELRSAAFGLYQRCIRFLQEHAYADNTYSLKVTGLRSLPYPGDRVNVDVTTLNYSIPGYGTIVAEGESIHGDYRIGSWSMDGSGDKVSFSVNLTEHEFIGIVEAEEDVIVTRESYEAYTVKPRGSGTICGDLAIIVEQTDETDVIAIGNAANCQACITEADLDGHSITVAFSVPTPGVQKVKAIGFLPTPTVPFVCEITQEPTMDGGYIGMDDPLIVCFRFEDHPWNVGDSVVLKTYFRQWG